MIGYNYFSYVKGRQQRAVQFDPAEKGKEAGRKHRLIVRHIQGSHDCTAKGVLLYLIQ
jgi:hypothetical protein